MLRTLKHRLHLELGHFLALSRDARLALAGNTVYEFSVPITYIFVNTFLQRQTSDPTVVARYNLAMFVGTALMFIINGYLFRFFKLSHLYAAGMVLQAVVVLPLFFVAVVTIPLTVGFGFLSGSALGLFWSNRNYFTQEFTHDENRSYYTSIELLAATTAAIIMPIVIGWVIELGDYWAFYSANQAYQLLGLVAVVSLVLGSTFIRQVKLPQPAKYNFTLWGKFSRRWHLIRSLNFFHGFKNSFDLFFNSIIVFYFFGKEGSFGSISSLAAVLALIASYIVGRKLRTHQRISLLFAENSSLILVGLLFTIFFAPWSTLIYILVASVLREIAWIAVNPIIMKAVDLEDDGRPEQNYFYLVDREVFLNIGRVTGIGVFFWLGAVFGQTVMLRAIPLLIAVLYLGATGSAAWLTRIQRGTSFK